MNEVSLQALKNQPADTIDPREDVGAKLLKQMQKDGVELPSSNGLKGQKGTIKMSEKKMPEGHVNDSVSCNSFHEGRKSEAAESMQNNLETNMRKNLKLMHAAQAKAVMDVANKKKMDIEKKML